MREKKKEEGKKKRLRKTRERENKRKVGTLLLQPSKSLILFFFFFLQSHFHVTIHFSDVSLSIYFQNHSSSPLIKRSFPRPIFTWFSTLLVALLVCAHVALQVAGLTETLAARRSGTGERFLASVDADVRNKVRLAVEDLGANMAGMGTALLLCHVSVHVVTRESLLNMDRLLQVKTVLQLVLSSSSVLETHGVKVDSGSSGDEMGKRSHEGRSSNKVAHSHEGVSSKRHRLPPLSKRTARSTVAVVTVAAVASILLLLLLDKGPIGHRAR